MLAACSPVGKTDAIRYDDLQGRVANGSTYGWTIGSGGGSLLLVILTFFAVFTQYAIALELRVAYCGLQDANLDLQVMANRFSFAAYVCACPGMAYHAFCAKQKTQKKRTLSFVQLSSRLRFCA